MVDGEIKLIQMAIRGEASAFGSLYDYYQPKIYRFVFIKVSRREEAEDLTHQVFLKSWQNISEYTFQGFPFSAWLYRIARNQVIDYYRLKKINVSLEDVGDVVELKTENPSARKIDNTLGIESVRKAITLLNQEQQDVIILRFIEDFSPRETAMILDKTEGAVKLLQHRAIKNLKKIMGLV